MPSKPLSRPNRPTSRTRDQPMPEPTLTEQLRAMLPQPTPELTPALDKVAQLEHEHRAAVEQAQAERAFLLRAPREGLLYPGDALKLEDVLPKLKAATDD